MPKSAPSFKQCLSMMRSADPGKAEEGFNSLVGRERHHLDELIDAFHTEDDDGVRCWLLELIGDARAPEAFPLFQDLLFSQDTPIHFKIWAAYGVHEIDTKEARRLLVELKTSTFPQEYGREFQAAFEVSDLPDGPWHFGARGSFAAP